MTRNSTGSFFVRMRKRLFTFQIEREIFDRVMSHLLGDKDYGYPFATYDEMTAQTEDLGVQRLLDKVEGYISEMPDAYGKSFRHIMHRDLHNRLCMYEQVARHHIRRTYDPRFTARHLEQSP